MLTHEEIITIDWKKIKGLLPVIVQSNVSGEVLMLGYMNELALKKTVKECVVTFFSRKKNRLWTKGETSGNFLKVVNICRDCDNDSLLIIANPLGKTCHLSKYSCFDLKITNINFLFHLENILENKKNISLKNSYTSKLYSKGIKRIAQKVGEEAVEVLLAAMTNDHQELINESADLIYHFLILLHSKNLDFNVVINKLQERSNVNLLDR